MKSRGWLPLDEITYAERLKEFGYYNYFVGKWHLGHEPYYPIHQDLMLCMVHVNMDIPIVIINLFQDRKSIP